MKKINQLFEKYLEMGQLSHLSAASVQYTETKRAFMAGIMAFVMFNSDMSAEGRSDQHIEAESMKLLDELHEYWKSQETKG